MPTTLGGILLFAAVVLPGIVYVVARERHGAEQKRSTFRETVAVFAAGVTADGVAVVVLSPLWGTFINVRELLTDPGQLWREDPGLLLGWAFGLLAAASVLAFLTAAPRVRAVFRRVIREDGQRAAPSSWWMLFDKLDRSAAKLVGCVLDDGSYVQGCLVAFNNNADESGDRDMLLRQPVHYRPPGGDKIVHYAASVACVSASRIVVMFVSYLDHANLTSSAVEEAAEASPAEA